MDVANKFDADRSEKLFDAVLKAALEEATEQEAASYPSKEALDEMHPPSPAFNKRIMQIIAKEERTYKRKRSMRTFVRVTASIAVLFTVGIGTFVYWNLLTPPVDIHDEHPIAAIDSARLSDEEFYAPEPWSDTWDDAWDWGIAEETVIDINGQEVFLLEATWDGGYHFITWEHDDTVFQLSSNADVEDLLSVMESLIMGVLSH